jgi:hypothetical protein
MRGAHSRRIASREKIPCCRIFAVWFLHRAKKIHMRAFRDSPPSRGADSRNPRYPHWKTGTATPLSGFGESSGKPLRNDQFIACLGRILGRRIVSRAPGRKPKAGDGSQIVLL